MKKLAQLYITVVLLFALLFVAANLVFQSIVHRQKESSNIFMNRVVEGLEEEYFKKSVTTDSFSEEPDHKEDGFQYVIDTYMEANGDALSKEYGRSSIPDSVRFIPIDAGESNVSLINKENTSDKVWAVKNYDVEHNESTIIGFIVFEYKASEYSDIHKMLYIVLTAAFLIAVGICIYINCAVLRPFEKLSDYPVKLSRNEISEKLPETKNRLFGRFIWGINMLSDNLQNKQKRVDELSRDHMTMLTTIAHGIKTPVANIKLYADAISTGLYQPDGKVNESDVWIAAKISKNADDVTDLVKELIDQASGTVVDFKPNVQPFYLNELKEYLEEEYSNRLNMLHIPYTFEVSHNAIVKSDKSGICRILAQLMDNAIKYGNGEGITVILTKEEDGNYFVVKNKGEVPAEKELPYIFNRFWRGSNAEKTSGSGIGLFEAREIAIVLDGELYVKADAEAKEMEFDIYIP